MHHMERHTSVHYSDIMFYQPLLVYSSVCECPKYYIYLIFIIYVCLMVNWVLCIYVCSGTFQLKLDSVICVFQNTYIINLFICNDYILKENSTVMLYICMYVQRCVCVCVNVDQVSGARWYTFLHQYTGWR